MRKMAVVVIVLCLTAGGCAADLPGVVNPDVALDPNATYTLTYWDVEVPPMLGSADQYKEATTKAIENFCRIYPNIEVAVEWLSWHHAQARLNKALRDGVPPDLYVCWQGLARYDHVLQVPAELYLTGELHAAAERVAMVDGRLWAWPRWLWPRGLVMLGKDIESGGSQLDEILRQGWDLEAFARWLEQEDLTVVVNDYRGEFTGQLLLAATGANFERGWGGQELSQLLSSLEAWRDADLIRAGEYREISLGKNIIGGGTPALTQWLAGQDWEEIVLLPLPGFYRHLSCCALESTTVLLFRQVKYQGDEHTRAAAMLAQWLAEHLGTELAASFGAVSAWPGQASEEQLHSGYWRYLLDCADDGVALACNHRRGREEEDKFRLALNEQLAQFWAGKINGEELAQWMREQR